MRFLLSILLSTAGAAVGAQDIDGIWKGTLTQEAGGCYRKYFIELQISQNDGKIEGISYDYYDTSQYMKLQFTGSLNALTGRLVVVESSVLEQRIPRDCIPCIKTYELVLGGGEPAAILQGTWKGHVLGTAESCPAGTVSLIRVKGSAFTSRTVSVTPASKLPSGNRRIEVVKTLILDTTAVKIELYDNGQIDGDTVSIFLDGELILYRKGLDTRPLTFSIPIRAGREYEVMMYADNLGTIPPNTALMVVSAGRKTYELYLSSSDRKSAVVRIRYAGE